MSSKSLLACPDCHGPLQERCCPACERTFADSAGVLDLRGKEVESNAATHLYAGLYQRTSDPWAYESLAVEQFKAERVMKLVDRFAPEGGLVVEAGCATGHITRRLVTRPISAVVFDLIPQAVAIAKQHCPPPTAHVEFIAASATNLPLADRTVDLLLLLDGPISWKLSEAQTGQVFAEAVRVVKPTGRVLVMDYLTPSKFHLLRSAILRSRLAVVAEHPFPDRLSYILESMLRALRGFPPVCWFLANQTIASILAGLSSPFGYRGSKHVVIECRVPG